MTPPGTPKVIVTRPESSDGLLSTALREVGCEPVVAPGFTYAPASTAPTADEVAASGWTVWTSAASVEAVVPRPAAGSHHAAVGGATAQALAEAGIEAEIVGDGGGAELAELLLERLEPGTHLLYPRSAKADRSFAERLRTFGIEVDDRIAYDVLDADPALLRAALTPDVAAVTFASPSAVKGFADAVGDALLARDDVVVASIGATTTGALRSHLREPDVVAAQPSFTALADAVAAALQGARQG